MCCPSWSPLLGDPPQFSWRVPHGAPGSRPAVALVQPPRGVRPGASPQQAGRPRRWELAASDSRKAAWEPVRSLGGQAELRQARRSSRSCACPAEGAALGSALPLGGVRAPSRPPGGSVLQGFPPSVLASRLMPQPLRAHVVPSAHSPSALPSTPLDRVTQPRAAVCLLLVGCGSEGGTGRAGVHCSPVLGVPGPAPVHCLLPRAPAGSGLLLAAAGLQDVASVVKLAF